jgi:hypothetical protein
MVRFVLETIAGAVAKEAFHIRLRCIEPIMAMVYLNNMRTAAHQWFDMPDNATWQIYEDRWIATLKVEMVTPAWVHAYTHKYVTPKLCPLCKQEREKERRKEAIFKVLG